MRFRQKPVVIEAEQYDGSEDSAWYFIHKYPKVITWDPTPDCKEWTGRLMLFTRDCESYAIPGDWIIQGVTGEVYPCEDDVFQQTYEAVDA